MQVFILSFILIASVILIMSVGLLMGRRPVQGSCGGLNRFEGMGECELCGGDAKKCDEFATRKG
jgi:hypothetical protein